MQSISKLIKVFLVHALFWVWWAASVSWPWLLAGAMGTSIAQLFRSLTGSYVVALSIYLGVAVVLIVLPIPLLRKWLKRIAAKHSQQARE